MIVAAAGILLAARWTQTPELWLVVALAGALLIQGILTWRARDTASWRRVLFVLTGVGVLAVQGRFHLQMSALEADPEAVRDARAQQGAEALRAAFEARTDALARVAAAALDAPTDASAAFASLELLAPVGGDHAVLLARSGKPVAWSGRLLVSLDSLRAPSGIIATPFYLVAYVTATRGADFAVATLLLHADPPADGLTESLDARIAKMRGLQGFLYAEPAAASGVTAAVVLELRGAPVLAARAAVAPADVLEMEAWEVALQMAALMIAVMLLLLIAVAWRRDAGLGPRFFALTVAFAAVAIVPLSALSNLSTLFDPTRFLVRSGWRFTANAGALAISSALLLLALLSLRRARARLRSRAAAIAAVVVVAGAAPFLLRELARGVQVPSPGVPTTLWVAWQVTIFLASVTVLLLGMTAGQRALGRERGLPVWVAPGLAVLAALVAPLILEAPGVFPPAYTAFWVLVIASLAFTRRARAVVLPVALVAACGAVSLVWFSVVRERVALAVRDVHALYTPDRAAAVLLDRYAIVLDPARAARSRVELLSRFALTDLAGAEFPTEITTWAPDGARMAELIVGRAPGSTYGVNLFAAEAQRTRQPSITEVDGDPGVHLVLSVPHTDGSATTVVVAPRSRLVGADPFGAFLGFSPPPAPEPPYVLRLGDFTADLPSSPTFRGSWTRHGSELHGDWYLAGAGGLSRQVHAVVELRSFDALIARGVLLVLIDLLVLGSIWFLMVSADGALPRWWRRRRNEILTSYRTRLSVALFACFLVPSILFGFWSFQRLQDDDRRARDLLVRETLRGVATYTDLAEASARFETPLFLYADGLLVGTSDPLLEAIAPTGRLLPPSVMRILAEGDEMTTGRAEEIGPSAVRLGYRAATDSGGVRWVLAAPARLDERSLDRRRNDLAILLLFALSLGALAALWASGAASRQLSRPIRSLRDSALALARGERSAPLQKDPPLEFAPVFQAFGRMTEDLSESRAALEAAERRLTATLRNVASGVVAVDDAGMVTFTNPRAEAILGVALLLGAPLSDTLPSALAASLRIFLDGTADEAALEVELEGRRLNVRLARLVPGARRSVLTVDDVTEVTRAERVIAWGEMARQVAHEIKNPLTPMRLGLQHLRRARADGRVDFDRVLEENTSRMLAEIERLDEIARAFSRYGSAPEAEAPAVAVDLALIARDVLELERMGEAEITWDASIPERAVLVAARDRELREVLLNLLENARLAHATRVDVEVEAILGGGAELRVRDNGDGIAPETLPHVFDPQFSTRTSGSGLGLAISRRLITSWGGSIRAESAPGQGALFRIRLGAAPSDD